MMRLANAAAGAFGAMLLAAWISPRRPSKRATLLIGNKGDDPQAKGDGLAIVP